MKTNMTSHTLSVAFGGPHVMLVIEENSLIAWPRLTGSRTRTVVAGIPILYHGCRR